LCHTSFLLKWNWVLLQTPPEPILRVSRTAKPQTPGRGQSAGKPSACNAARIAARCACELGGIGARKSAAATLQLHGEFHVCGQIVANDRVPKAQQLSMELERAGVVAALHGIPKLYARRRRSRQDRGDGGWRGLVRQGRDGRRRGRRRLPGIQTDTR